MESDYAQKFSLAKLTLSKKRSGSSRPQTYAWDTEVTTCSGKGSSCENRLKQHWIGGSGGKTSASRLITEAVTKSCEVLSLLSSLRDSYNIPSSRSLSSSATQTTDDKSTQISLSAFSSPPQQGLKSITRTKSSGKAKGRQRATPAKLTTSRTDDIFSSETERGGTITSAQDFSQFTSSVTGPLLSDQKGVGMGTWVFEVPEELHFSSLEDDSFTSDTLEADDSKLRSLLSELQITEEDDDLTEGWTGEMAIET